MTAAAEAERSEPTDLPPPAPSAPSGTEVNESSGPIHTGSGDQLNDIKYYLERSRKARTWEVTPLQLKRLWDCFVKPTHFDHAANVLAQPDGLVILNGTAGIGRRTAGLMLLSADITPNTPVRLVPPDLEPRATQADRRIIEGSDVRDDDRLLLDLSEVDAESFTELQDYLHALQPALLSRRAKLVVVLPHLHGERLRTEFVPFLIEIGRPDMIRVLQRQLAVHGLEIENAFRYRKIFASASMAGLVRVVYQVRDARQEHPEADADLLLADVLGSAERRKQKVIGVVQAAQNARSRGLLIAAALLHDLSAETVFLAQHGLLEMLRPADDRVHHALELPGVDESLASIGLDVSVAPGPDQRLRFADEELGTEVLRHFWDDLPWLRGPLTDWVGEQVRTRSLDRFDLAKIAHRFGAQCRRTRQADLALRLVEQWSSDRHLPQRSAAYALLEDLLDDNRTASPARQMLYRWAQESHLPSGRVAIVIAACVNILADGYLDQAVVRLSWLAKHSDSGVQYEARQGLARLAAEPGDRLKVIDLVLEPWRFTPRNFAAAAAPEGLPMFLGTEAIERIVTGWQRTLTETEPHRRGTLFRPWLTAYADCLADDRRTDSEGVLQVLAMICTQQPDLLNALLNTTLDWLDSRSEDPLRRQTAHAVNEVVRRGRRAVGPTLLEAGS